MSVVSYIFDSNTTVAVATFVTAGAAYWVYRRQKVDTKRNAANIVLLEIRSAERRIRSVKKSLSQSPGNLPETTYLMKDDGWSSHKYLFVKDFNRDDWDTISEFYENCLLYDEALRKNGEAFGSNEQQIRATAHHLVETAAGDMVDSILANPTTRAAEITKFNQRVDALDDSYLVEANKPLYTPKKYIQDAKAFLEQLPTNISQTSPGDTLKRLAQVKE